MSVMSFVHHPAMGPNWISELVRSLTAAWRAVLLAKQYSVGVPDGWTLEGAPCEGLCEGLREVGVPDDWTLEGALREGLREGLREVGVPHGWPLEGA
jgi:hypothetical protein